MFGYVKPKKSELLVREFEAYNGIYCSLCRQLGKSYGPFAKLTLNYDCTFFALVLLALVPKHCPEFSVGRCTVNPLKKCTFCSSGAELEFAASLTVILAYYKVRDDLKDPGVLKRVAAGFLFPMAALIHRKAIRKQPEIESVVSMSMERQQTVERADHLGLDQCAEPTALMLGKLLPLAAEREAAAPDGRVLQQVGYYLGRWIYLVDAADDLESDLHSGAFNPFAALQKQGKPLSEIHNYANQVLNGTLSRLGAAANLLDFNALGPIVRNVLLLGLPQIQKELLDKKEKGNV